MASEPSCKVKDDLVNQLIVLNGKLNALSPSLLRSEQSASRSAGAEGDSIPRN
jgi:hypothetical protein